MSLPTVPHVLVTGGAGAIGAALAREFSRAHAGARLSVVDVDGDGASRVASGLGRDATSYAWDLSLPHELPAAVAALETARGPVDVLVNCAGVMEIRSLVATPWELAERLLAIDLTSPLRLMSLLAPGMCARGSGVIVNVSSLAGVTKLRGCVYYGAAKAGLAMASEIARLELAPKGVRVVTVYPGPVRSALEARARGQAPQTLAARCLPIGDAAELASKVVAACAHGRARVVYPTPYSLASWLPSLANSVTGVLSPVPLDR